MKNINYIYCHLIKCFGLQNFTTSHSEHKARHYIFKSSNHQIFKSKIFQFFNLSIFQLFVGTLIITACTERSYVPKPVAYPRIEFPEKEYKYYDGGNCGFSFRYPAYAIVKIDSSSDAEPCWFNIDFPQFNASIHMSYKPVSSFKNFYEMSEDARTFAYKHTVKAEDIYDSFFRYKNNNTSGILYSIAGNTASSTQFYATDSSKHYLRGALYFNSKPNKDSLEPVVYFLRADIDTLLKSLKWK